MSKEKEEVIDQQVAEADESSEDIQKTIAELNAKLQKKVEAETEEDEIELVEYPLASFDLTIEKGQTVHKRNVTPPEAMLLVAEFHTKAGGMPVNNETFKLNRHRRVELEEEIKRLEGDLNLAKVRRKESLQLELAALKDSIKCDPRAERARLMRRYIQKKVAALFPSNLGNDMPKTFKRALSVGVTMTTPSERLMTMHLTESSATTGV